jgi:hypothetical protein
METGDRIYSSQREYNRSYTLPDLEADMYNPVTDAIIAELSQIVGAENTLIRPDTMGPYTHDHVTLSSRLDPTPVPRHWIHLSRPT